MLCLGSAKPITRTNLLGTSELSPTPLIATGQQIY
jgi:hypothetical protein